MTSISFARHQFPPDVIRHAVWLYLRFTLSLRDVAEMLAERVQRARRRAPPHGRGGGVGVAAPRWDAAILVTHDPERLSPARMPSR